MKKGDIVTIYQDPLTKQEVEGYAQLREHEYDHGNLEYWQVKFLGGGDGDPIVRRFIKKEKYHDTITRHCG